MQNKANANLRQYERYTRRKQAALILALLAVVIAGGVLNAYLTRNISDRYVSAAEELLVLTESGHSALQRGMELWLEAQKSLELYLGADELKQLKSTLSKLEALVP